MPDNSDTEQEARGGLIVPSWLFTGWLLLAGIGGLSWLWGRTPKALDEVRRLAINVLVLAPILLIGYTVWQAVNEDMMIVDAFTVPKALEDQGYTGKSVAQRLIDRVEFIHSTAKTRVERQQIGHESQFASLSNLQVPQSGLTIETVVSMLRKLFRPPDDRIGGEITIKQEAQGLMARTYAVSLRFDIERNNPDRLGRPTDSRHFVKHFEASSLDELIEQSAQAIVEKTAPATLASYLYQASEWRELDKLLDQLVESSKQKIRVRAWTLRGVRLAEQCRFDEALPYFERAIRANPNGKFVMIKYGEALTKAGWLDEAIEVFEQAEKLPSKSNVLLYGSWAKALALASSDGLSAAEAKLRHADSAGRQGGRRSGFAHSSRLGRYLARPQAVRSRKRRVSNRRRPRSPGSGDIREMGPRLVRAGRLCRRELEKLRLAIARNGHAPETRYRLGWALLHQEDIAGAIGAFREAAAVADPGQARQWLEMADNLAGEPDRARVPGMLEAVKKLAPTGCLPTGNNRSVPGPEAAARASAPYDPLRRRGRTSGRRRCRLHSPNTDKSATSVISARKVLLAVVEAHG